MKHSMWKIGMGAATVMLLGSACATWAVVVPAGKKVYDAKCASCHGKNGKGNPAMAKVFKTDLAALDMTSEAVVKKTDEELIKVTAEGKGKMPAYSKQLKAEEIKQSIEYIRTLAGATKPAAAPEKK